ncbi:hypothetical protein [Pedobacter frigiditerrae]|uniref:hypothetical protein n=1 Tax=Pedobacter frigiditerrae TaxID=2530452 RepID=UPI00292D7A09|nr:hypothetical protein [Pedobacter frigiditerrae]
MKTKNIQKLCLLALSVLLFTSCSKEAPNIFNMFTNVSVTYNSSDPRCVTDYKLINDKEEVWIDFTITSDKEDMYSYVIETSAGTATPSRITTPITDGTKRRSFSFVYKIPVTQMRDGLQSFRVYPLNEKGVYMGDGYKKVTVEQNPSYVILANRDIYMPDTVAKVLPSFFSLSDGTTYSYTNGATNAAKIDFGIYRTAVRDGQGIITGYVHNIYNTSAPATTFPIYDVSTWTKRLTKFSAPVASQGTIFTNSAFSGSTIETLAKARTINLNATTTGITSTSAVFFQTPEGKYGMLYFFFFTSDIDKKPYCNVSVKMQK